MRACRDGRRFVWAIDPWSRLSQQPVVRSQEFGLAGSERTWMLSYTHEKLGFHLTCVGESLFRPSHIQACRQLVFHLAA